MSAIVIILAVTTAAFAIAWLLALRNSDEKRVAAIVFYRVALAYIASGRTANAAQLFASSFLYGHDATMARHFPDYPEFQAAEIERMEREDG